MCLSGTEEEYHEVEWHKDLSGTEFNCTSVF